MEYSIDKSRRNATENSDNFQLVLKEQKRKFSQILIQNQSAFLQRRIEYKAPWNNPPSMGNTRALIDKANYKKIIKLM